MFPHPPGVFCTRSRPPTGHMVKKKIQKKQKNIDPDFPMNPGVALTPISSCWVYVDPDFPWNPGVGPLTPISRCWVYV